MSAASAAKFTSATKVATATKAAQPPRAGMRTGIVVSVDSSSTVSVNISGALQQLPYLDSYGPTVGDNVQVLMMNNTWVVIGHVGPTPWVDFTGGLTWTGSNTPAFGNATVAAAYHLVGDTVTYQGSVIMGSTTTIATGGWGFNLPFQIAADVSVNAAITGSALLYDLSTPANRQAGVCTSSGQNTLTFYGGNGQVSDTVPFTWAVSDRIVWCITYARQT